MTVLTGEYAAPILRSIFDAHGFADVEVMAVQNHFFGGNIKVAGLLTGQDLTDALAEVDDSRVCLVPDVCLSEGRFLDGLTLEDLPSRGSQRRDDRYRTCVAPSTSARAPSLSPA